MNWIKKNLPLIVRILVFLLFIVSGVAKMFPIWAFEKQLVDLDIASWCSAPYFSRLIIALEIAIGIAILQNHFIKKIVIPATIILLVIFCGHLSIEMYKHGAMNGNCGCFGQLIPMTPLEAFIKNLITIGLLIYLYKNVNQPEKSNPLYLVIIYLSSALLMFSFFPFAPCETEKKAEIVESQIELENTVGIQDSVAFVQEASKNNVKLDSIKDNKLKGKTANDSKIILEKQPKKVNSKFRNYSFTDGGNSKVNIDEGKQVLCMFVPGCDHCRDAAKELRKLAQDKKFPPISILFMDEEAELIPEFFKETQINFPYQVIGIVEFWQKLGNDSNTPGVMYLWNGNIMKVYEGTEANKFNPEGLKKAIESKF
jgi:hypothetical protein